MNKSKKDLIKSIQPRIDDYIGEWIEFLKEHYLNDDILNIDEAGVIIYEKYRKDFILNRSMGYMFNDKIEPLDKYENEAHTLELEIKKNYYISRDYNDVKDITIQFDNLLEELNRMGLNGMPTNEDEVFSFDEKKTIKINEIVDVDPDFTKFMIKEYIPVMREFLSKNRLMPSGMTRNMTGNRSERFIGLLNQICAWDDQDDDSKRLYINELIGRI